MQLLVIGSSYLQRLIYHFLANFIMVLPVEGATVPANHPCQMSDISDIGAAKGLTLKVFYLKSGNYSRISMEYAENYFFSSR